LSHSAYENYGICFVVWFVWIVLTAIVTIGTMWATSVQTDFSKFVLVFNLSAFTLFCIFEQHHQVKELRSMLSSKIASILWVPLLFHIITYSYRTT